MASLQELTAVHQWWHVPSGSNPADLISKDLDPRKLLVIQMKTSCKGLVVQMKTS